MNRFRISSISCLILLTFVFKMAESADPSRPEVHIVYTERPQDEEPEDYHLRTLSKLLGGDDAAKDSLIYSYSTAGCGFSAKLTPDQVQRLSREPGIIQIVPSQTYQLHGGSGNRVNSRPGNRLYSGPGNRY